MRDGPSRHLRGASSPSDVVGDANDADVPRPTAWSNEDLPPAACALVVAKRDPARCRRTEAVVDDEPAPSWTSDLDSDRALRAATGGDVGVLPARSVALYARWWQLETWLRELIYVELRALYGSTWDNAVKVATG